MQQTLSITMKRNFCGTNKTSMSHTRIVSTFYATIFQKECVFDANSQDCKTALSDRTIKYTPYLGAMAAESTILTQFRPPNHAQDQISNFCVCGRISPICGPLSTILRMGNYSIIYSGLAARVRALDSKVTT